MNLETYIETIPKAELHVHIEGTLEPEMLFEMAKRNGINIPYKSISELKNAYCFSNLQEFLDIYYQGANVLITEQDFYELTIAYLKKLRQQNVMHVEIMFDPQTHTLRGIDLALVLNGINKAMDEGRQRFGITSGLILSFLRHLTEEEAIDTFKSALPHKDRFIAVGLDSSENGHPPKKFERVFKLAKEHQLKCVAHAGEEGPAKNIRDALDILSVSRIDHGNSALNDSELCQVLISRQIPLTLCPLSNLALKVVSNLEDHPLRQMLDLNMLVTINSDDPAYFGGHLNDNYKHIAQAQNLTKEDITLLALNSVKAGFISFDIKNDYIERITEFARNENIELSKIIANDTF